MSGKGPAGVADLLPGVMELSRVTSSLPATWENAPAPRTITPVVSPLGEMLGLPTRGRHNHRVPHHPPRPETKRPAAPSRIEEAMKASERAAQIALNILQADGHDKSRA